jgi:hypothetical protein
MEKPELVKALETSKNTKEFASFDHYKHTTQSSEKKSKHDYVSDMFNSHVVEPKYYHQVVR